MTTSGIEGSLGPDDIKKLTDVVATGVRIRQEIDDLRGGLKDTVAAVAEELAIGKAFINEAITTIYKQTIEKKRESLDTVQIILDITGNG